MRVAQRLLLGTAAVIGVLVLLLVVLSGAPPHARARGDAER